MNSKNRHRVNFYSKEDLSASHELKRSEEILDNFSSSDNFEINDFFEFYNVKVYFDHNLYLDSWNDHVKGNYQKVVESVFIKLKEQLLTIDDNNLENTVKNIEFNYYEDFWQLFNNLNIGRKIDGQNFLNILKNNPRHINYILKQKKVVEKFDKKIKEFLLHFKNTTQLLLSKLEEKHFSRNAPNYHFPLSLTLQDKEQVINDYLDGDEPNLNYVRLIENSKDSTELRLSPKTRLKAKRLSERLNNEIFGKGHSWSMRVQVGIDKDQIEPAKYNHSDGLFEVVYSEKLLNNCLRSDVQLFHLFSQLFMFLDESNLITLVNKSNEVDSFERTFIKSKNAYEKGQVFTKKEYLSNLQLIIFDDYLRKNNSSLEKIVNSFIDYLNKLIVPNHIHFSIRINESSFVEKIRNTSPDFEFLLKQFKLFSAEREIDLELIQLDSNPIHLSDIYSLNDKKYIYSNNNLIINLKNVFFSSQSMLYYVEEFKEKYECLYDLLINENIKLGDFENYQKTEIERLITDEYLKINEQGFVKIKNDVKLFIIGQLHNNEVINYWVYPSQIRNEIDALLEDKSLKSESTLLTIHEKNYFNYYLNKKEFTNGFDLRNKYLHGTNSFSEGEHKMDYFRLLKIIILTLLKMEDDIIIFNKNKLS